MMNTLKITKSQENMIQCALAAMEMYKQATSSQMSLFSTPEPKREKEEENDMAKKKAVKLPTATLEEIKQTAKDALDAKAKEIIYNTLGAEIYSAWFYKTGFVCSLAQGTPSFEADNGFIKQQILHRFWEKCQNEIKKEMCA